METIFENKNSNMSKRIEQYKMAHTGWHYSMQRIDLLIISISGAGVYICLEAMKYSVEHYYPNVWSIKLAGAFYVISIILNFISQQTGMKSNGLDMMLTEEQIDCEDDPKDDATKEKITNLKCKIELSNSITTILNKSSMISMFIALAITLLYFFITF